MAVITDPDALTRFDVIYNTVAQKISTYPIGDVQRVMPDKTFTTTEINSGLNEITITSHGYVDGDIVYWTTTSGNLDPLQVGVPIYVHQSTTSTPADIITLHPTFDDAISKTNTHAFTGGDTAATYTLHNHTFQNAWVQSNGTLERYKDWSTAASGRAMTDEDTDTDADIVCIMNTTNAGHYFLKTHSTVTLTLADIDTGVAGTATTSLTTALHSFDANTDVTLASDQIVLTAHGYNSGDAIVYNANGGTDLGGIATGGVFFIIRIDANTVQLAISFANATAATPVPIDITSKPASETQEIHDRLVVAVFNNGASAVVPTVTPLGERVTASKFDTTGDGDGDIKDGISLQAYYSFSKEEWRTDSIANDDHIPSATGALGQTPDTLITQKGNWSNDHYENDLIRFEFPFEAITSEQFEIGGGTTHDNWTWFNEYTRKKVRTGGFAEKTRTGAFDKANWTGIITLGTLDINTEVYYQQVSVTNSKVDFTFTGVVNEAIQVLDDPNTDGNFADGFDRRTFLKLFARKKGRNYAGSEISAIGVTTIQTIVNRFPLTHTTDAAITITDGQLLGSSPYRFRNAADVTSNQILTDTDGIKTAGQLTFTNTGATDFAAGGVVAGDILEITVASGSNDLGFYEIVTVATTTLTVKEVETVANTNDFTFSTGWAATDSGGVTFRIFSDVLVATKSGGTATDKVADTGIVETGTAGVGTITHNGQSWVTTDGVAVKDIVIISQSYVLSFDAATDLNDATETFTITDHGLATGDRIRYDLAGGTLIGGLTDNTVFFAIFVDSNNFKVATTLANAHAGTAIDLTDGVGTQNWEVQEKDGYYPVLDANTTGASNPADTVLFLDTKDQPFPAVVKPNTSYRIVAAGQYLQFQERTIQASIGATSFNFNNAARTITRTGGTAFNQTDVDGPGTTIVAGDMVIISGAEDTANNGRYTVLTNDSGTQITLVSGDSLTTNTTDTTAVVEFRRGFTRTIGSAVGGSKFGFRWKISGNAGTLINNFQSIQRYLRANIDIDNSFNSSIGNVTDLLMSFATPTGTGLDLFIDELATSDINNATFNDHSSTARNFPFTASGNLVFSTTLTDDANAKYWMFFTDDNSGDNLGRDYGTEDAIIVNDATSPTVNAIQGNVNGSATHTGSAGSVDASNNTSIPFTFDYDGNVQRGSASAATDAPVTLVAIGLSSAQFVIAAGTITRATGLTISAVAALERNYLNV